jgi:signal transduction histidine kinase
VELVASVVSWGEAPAILAHGIDITEKLAVQKRNVELEDKIRQAERMETLGILAGGVAHDLNNILGGIINMPEVLLMKIAADDPLRKSLQMIQDSGKRAAALVDDLLTIGRGSKARHIELSLNAVIRQYLDSAELQHLLSRHPHATITEDLAEALYPILGSPLHLNKVIMNLVTNAVESLRASGVVRIQTRNVLVDHPIAGYETVQKGDYVQLTVLDTGMGMEEGDIQRIFEPFFSKKTLGKSGTGLGMTIVWNTVADHDGYIEVESVPARGTTFHLYFPTAGRGLDS